MDWSDPSSLNKISLSMQIIALEAKQARPLRELTLGDAAALERVQDINAKIVALRTQLAQLPSET